MTTGVPAVSHAAKVGEKRRSIAKSSWNSVELSRNCLIVNAWDLNLRRILRDVSWNPVLWLTELLLEIPACLLIVVVIGE